MHWSFSKVLLQLSFFRGLRFLVVLVWYLMQQLPDRIFETSKEISFLSCVLVYRVIKMAALLSLLRKVVAVSGAF